MVFWHWFLRLRWVVFLYLCFGVCIFCVVFVLVFWYWYFGGRILILIFLWSGYELGFFGVIIISN